MNTKLLKLKLFVSLFFIVLILNAQQKNNLYSFYSQSIIKAFNNNPINYYNYSVPKYTQVNLFGNTKHTNIKGAQTAFKEQNLGINVTGVYKKKNTLFLGEIGFVKNYLDEIGFKQSNFYFDRNLAEENPFYLFTYSNGNWNNQNYTLNGQVLFPILKDKLYGGIKVNYKTAQFFRAEEPATEITYLDYVFSGNLIYNVNSKHSLGTELGFGKLNKEIDLNYFSLFTNIPSNTTIYNRIYFGYGANIAARSTSTKENENNYSVKGIYNYKTPSNILNTEISFKNRDYTFLNISSANLKGYEVGTFNSKKVGANIYWLNIKKQQQLTIDANYTIGENFNEATQGKNYEVTLLNAKAKYQFFKDKKDIIIHDFGIKTEYNFLKKTDFQIVNSSQYTTLYLGTFYGKDFKLKGNNKLFIQTELGSRFSLNKKAFFSVNDPMITKVEIPNFHLQTVTQLQGKIKVGYQSKIRGNSYLNLELGFDYLTYFKLNKKIVNISNNLNTGSFIALKYVY